MSCFFDNIVFFVVVCSFILNLYVLKGDGKCYKFEKAAEGVNKSEAEAACKEIGGGQLIGEEALQNENIE